MFGNNFNLAKGKGRREEKMVARREGLLAESRDGEKERGNC